MEMRVVTGHSGEANCPYWVDNESCSLLPSSQARPVGYAKFVIIA